VLAAERGVSRPLLTEQLRDVIDLLAATYEGLAYAPVMAAPKAGCARR
jgi:hypothetical protein